MLSALHSALANSRSRLVRRVWRLVHRFASRWFDPEVRVAVGRRRLWMRFSHPLPFLLSNHPHYDTLLPRLGRALAAQSGGLQVIDVGANIGDTAALMLDQVEARILAIEPDADYHRLLRKNAEEMAGVTCVQTALTDHDDGRAATMTKVAGTAHVTEPGGTTLDSLLATHPEFAGAGLLKVDTDGFDAKVLRGARGYLAAAKPAVFFELAPEYYARVGGEDPLAPFEILRAAGYTAFALYDNEGWLALTGGPGDLPAFAQAVDYARARGHYYDVLAFHARQGDFARSFLAAEREHFRRPT